MIVNYKQGSLEWLKWRSTGVTATDFSIIAANHKLCKNIYHKSVKRLIREKKSSEPMSDNKYFYHGRRLENTIIAGAGLISIEQSECWEYDLFPEFICSLDGRCTVLNKIVEAKMTTKAIEEIPIITEYYKYQVAHQCYVCNIPTSVLAIGRVDKLFRLQEIICIDVVAQDVIAKDLWLIMCNSFLEELKQ